MDCEKKCENTGRANGKWVPPSSTSQGWMNGPWRAGMMGGGAGTSGDGVGTSSGGMGAVPSGGYSGQNGGGAGVNAGTSGAGY